MIVLGLDPSLTAYGMCILDSKATGLQKRVMSRHEATLSSTVPVTRFVHFRSIVNDLLNEYKPDLVGIESPAYDAGPFQVLHYSLMTYSLEAAFNHRVDVVLFDPATLKSLVKGTNPNNKGIMSKLDMQRFVMQETMDTNIIHDGEADAYCIAHFSSRFTELMEGTLDPATLNPSEFRVFLGKTKSVKTLKGTIKKRMGHAFRENSRYYKFSEIPKGSVDLPKKSMIPPDLMSYLEKLEDETK
jgi:Holliday junction resolvasome RuvABC endonuclease subunit